MAAKLSRPLIRSFDCGQSSTKSSASTEPTNRKSLVRINVQNLSTRSAALVLIRLPLTLLEHTSYASLQSLHRSSSLPPCPANGFCEFTVNRIVGNDIEAVSDVSVTHSVQQARVISFFTMKDGKISRMVEFWPEPFPAPDNRRHLVEKLDPSSREVAE